MSKEDPMLLIQFSCGCEMRITTNPSKPSEFTVITSTYNHSQPAMRDKCMANVVKNIANL